MTFSLSKYLRFFLLISVLSFIMVSYAEDPRSIYREIYAQITSAETKASAGQNDVASKEFQEVLFHLENFQKQFPDWEPEIVKFRIQYARNQVKQLKGGAPEPQQPLVSQQQLPPTPPPAAPAPVPQPVAAMPAPAPQPAPAPAPQPQQQPLPPAPVAQQAPEPPPTAPAPIAQNPPPPAMPQPTVRPTKILPLPEPEKIEPAPAPAPQPVAATPPPPMPEPPHQQIAAMPQPAPAPQPQFQPLPPAPAPAPVQLMAPAPEPAPLTTQAPPPQLPPLTASTSNYSLSSTASPLNALSTANLQSMAREVESRVSKLEAENKTLRAALAEAQSRADVSSSYVKVLTRENEFLQDKLNRELRKLEELRQILSNEFAEHSSRWNALQIRVRELINDPSISSPQTMIVPAEGQPTYTIPTSAPAPAEAAPLPQNTQQSQQQTAPAPAPSASEHEGSANTTPSLYEVTLSVRE